VPLIERRDLQYSARFNFDQTKSNITGIAAGVAPYYYSGGDSGGTAMYYVAPNVQYGAIYGRQFLAGTATSFRRRSSRRAARRRRTSRSQPGLLVWTGGYGLGEGITKNLWMAVNGTSTAPWGKVEQLGQPDRTPRHARQPGCQQLDRRFAAGFPLLGRAKLHVHEVLGLCAA